MELWEDETIIYGCKNNSLVIDGIKNVYSVSYKCLDDGTYAAPKGKEEGEPWPECTLKPIDPCELVWTGNTRTPGKEGLFGFPTWAICLLFNSITEVKLEGS